MMLSWLTVLLIIFASLSSSITADDPCRFQDASKGVIDLTSLGRTDGKAAYPDVVPPAVSSYRYSYNPCKPFTEGSACINVATCQVSMDEMFVFPIGEQSSAEWNPGNDLGGLPSVSYRYGEKTSIVTLQCSTDGSNIFEALGEEPLNTYRFRLINRCACWNGCGASPPQKNCSIDGKVYTSDKQIIESFPFGISINPPMPLPSPPTFSYALVDIDSHVTELALVNIESVPPAVFCLSQVQVLSVLDSNDISISPEIIRLASSLISFTVVNTSTSLVLPPALFNMPLLSTLSIVNCGLEMLSEDIGKLEHLSKLTLDGNHLLALPSALSKLPSLVSLSVNNNPRLSSLDVLDGSTSLTALQGSHCLIDHLPTNIRNLRTIELNNNLLTSLDGIETITSASCDLLSFSNNHITSASSPSLENIQTVVHFDLSTNRLITLPDSFYHIKDLRTLDIRTNLFDAKEKQWILGVFRLTNTTVFI